MFCGRPWSALALVFPFGHHLPRGGISPAFNDFAFSIRPHPESVCYVLAEEFDALSHRRAEPTKNGFLDKP
jgi:hypothetical protein